MVVVEVSHLEMFLLVICFWLGILLWVVLVVPSLMVSCHLLVKVTSNAAELSTVCHLVILMGILRGILFLLETSFVLLGTLVWRGIVSLLETSFFLLGILLDAFVHPEFWIFVLLFLSPCLLVDHGFPLHGLRDMILP